MTTKNKRGRGRPTVDSERVDTRLSRDILDGLDAYSATQEDEPGRAEAVRRIVRDWLSRRGYLKSGK
ncbi:hypothetical protein [Parvibaculum sp.]|uniref:hypothetical protein n=1 Tax=Parvibaculum sp. TaxID=2024848 RepID=UPI001B2AB413|nr:hypothetical protein [Parvibaculum sp.]MBO6635992.1 hypothetical protein [Parvibaculum sp.]MBO6679159.1 hypothetical protein [Parvibaculum sp.]MBO6685654.1 hypothetical protein [Parvibaculum sp.]MBO6905791.1 hypothetical protein [Parvibaculum sp.]